MATAQRERNAAQAREKMEARREDADGAAGWVAGRAGQWRDPAKAKDDDYVERNYDEVRQSIQDGMDTLARRRTFPVFG
jgi:hypothetical protein